MKRQKTAYPGVFTKDVRRIGGKGTEKSYYIIFKKDGKNIEEHVGYQYRDNMTPAKASKIRGERIEHRRKSRKQLRQEQAATAWTFQKLWTHYTKKRGEDTINSADKSRYNTYLKETIGNKSPVGLQPSDLDPIHELLRNKADGTKYSVLQLINRISTYGKKQSLCEPIRFFIELPKVDVERTEMLTEKQLKTLLDVLHTDGGPVAKLMELALTTGMRKTEMLDLRWDKVNLEQNFITLKSKTKTTNSIPFNESAGAVFLSLDTNTEYVFQELRDKGMNWIMARANMLKARAGLPNDFRAFHGMRHAFASLLASKGVELYKVSALLTHKNLAMTQRYAHLSDQSLKDATSVMGEAVAKANETE
jgi:integrase